MRITPEYITELKDNQIFVFGSNTKGRHGLGAAKDALKWGAIYGEGSGLFGQTYAIPSKNGETMYTLPIMEIKKYVDEFIEFAKENQNLTFLVTPIGCGLSGLEPYQIAPLFKKSKDIENIHLPQIFWEILK